MKRFLYLVQAKNELPDTYALLHSEDSDVLVLTWGAEKPDCIYLPRSTWTQGRNRLRQEILNRGLTDYLYFIYLDDDVVFLQGDWRQFEQALLKYEPAVGAPYYVGNATARGSNLSLEAHRCVAYDAIFNAFHREVFCDGLILPYHGDYDAQSWWLSQWFVIQLSRLFFAPDTIQINTVHIGNTQHGEYPRTLSLLGANVHFYRDTNPFGAWLGRLLPARWTAKLYPASVRLRWLLWHRYHLPRPRKTRSYVVPASERRRVLDVEADFWRSKS